MPRHVDPHLGCDGFSDYEPFELSEADAARLGRLLRLSPEDVRIGGMKRAIEEVGTMYRRWRRRGPDAFSRAEARASLEHVAQCPVFSLEALSLLNGRAEALFLDQVYMIPGVFRFAGTLTVLEALTEGKIPEEYVAKALQNAIDQLKPQKGADRDTAMLICVSELCSIYREFTGQRVTHSAKKNRHHVSKACSAAGRFVTACFLSFEVSELASPNAKQDRAFLERRVETAMREVMKASRSNRPHSRRVSTVSASRRSPRRYIFC